MYLVVYNNITGKIIGTMSTEFDKDTNQYLDNVETFTQNFKEEDKVNLNGIYINDKPERIAHYKIVNEELIKRPDEEIQDIKKYRRILTEEERLDILLQPTSEEITKAEATIETLSLLREVGLI